MNFLTFTHTSSLGCLQATACSTTRHPVGDTMGIFMNNNVIFEGTITLRLERQ